MDEWFRWLGALVAAAWLGTLTWVWNRQVKRIDGKASKYDLAAAIKRLDEHLADDKVMHQLMYSEIKSVSVSIARLEGAVSGLPQKDC